MLRMLTCGLGFVVGATASPGAQSTTHSPTDSARVLLETYCITCHNQRLETGGLALDQLDIEHVGEAADIWEKVVGKLRAGQMPPPGRPRPEQRAYDGFAAWLATELDEAGGPAQSRAASRPSSQSGNRPDPAEIGDRVKRARPALAIPNPSVG